MNLVRPLVGSWLLAISVVGPTAMHAQEPFDWKGTPVLHRTLVGSIGDRRLELELRLEGATPGGSSASTARREVGSGWTFYARMPWVMGTTVEDGMVEGIEGFNRAVEIFFNEAEREFAPLGGEVEPEFRDPGPWAYEAWYRVPLAMAGLLSVELTFFTYTGGAHPNMAFATFTWDLRSGRALELRELFRSDVDALPVLAEIVRPELAIRLGDSANPEWIREGTAPTSDNWRAWTLTPAGLGIVFGPYQVASYADGPQRVTIAWQELRDLLDPEGPVAAFW